MHAGCNVHLALSVPLLQSNPSSGITSQVYICMLGLLPAAWSLLGYDSTAHMIEETKDADASAGWAMPYAVGISAISGLPYIVALTLCVQVASSPTFPTVPHSCPPCPIPPPPLAGSSRLLFAFVCMLCTLSRWSCAGLILKFILLPNKLLMEIKTVYTGLCIYSFDMCTRTHLQSSYTCILYICISYTCIIYQFISYTCILYRRYMYLCTYTDSCCLGPKQHKHCVVCHAASAGPRSHFSKCSAGC